MPVTNGTFNYLKKPKVTHSKEVGTTKLSALERRPKSDLSFSSSKIDDRMTNIYFDLEYSPTIKKTVLETLRSNPSSPTIGNTSKENVEGNIKSTVVTTEGKNESLSSSLPSCPSSTVFDTTNSITKSTQNIPYSNDILGHLPKKYSDLPTTNMQLSQVPSLDIHNNKKATSPVQHPIHNTSNKLSSNNDSDVNQKPSISEGIDEKATKCVPSSIANDNDTKSISSPDGDSQLSILPSEKNNITTLLTGTTSVFSRLDSPAISSGATTLPTSGVNLRSYDTSNVSSGSKTNTGFVINSASFQSFSKEGNSSQSQNIGSTNIEGVHSEKPFPTFHFGAKSVDDSKATFSSLASNIANVPSTETKSVVPNVHDSPLKIDNTSVSISTSNTFADLASEPVKNTSLQGGLFNFGQSKVQSPAKVSSAPFTFSAVTSEGLAQKDESHKDVSVPQFSFGSQQTSAATVVARDTMQPTFSLSNPKMSESSSVDIVQNDQEKAVAISKSSFTFGNNNGKPNFMFASNENKIDIHKGLPVVSTVNTLTGQSTLPMFTGNKSASETKTSSLAFGDNKQVNTSFTFGNIQQNAVSSTTPLFSFGNKQQSTIRAPDSESKTGFSFETNGTKSVPFGSAANPTTSESFLFGNGQKSNTITTTSAFTFGSGQQQQTTNTTSVFGQTLTTTTTSAFSKTQTSTFGQPQTSTIPSAFGQLASIPTTSAFGQQDSSVKQGFGQPQTPLSLSSSTAFGQTSNSFGQPQSTLTTTFGQPQTLSLPPAFGQQQTPATPTFGMQSSSTNAFSQNSTITGFGQPPTSSATTPFSQPATSGITAFGQTQNPAPAFGQQQKNVDPPQFAFGGSSTSTFGQQSTATQNKPTFNFGNTQQPNNSSSAQPTFSFGSTVPLKTPTTSASTFSFGGGTVNQTPSASTFAFGNGQQKEQPRNSPFPFGSPQTITTAATSSPAFSFGSSKAGSQSSNTFKFGSNQQIAAPSSATFGFGDTTSAPSAAPTSFNFGSANGGNNDVKPGGPVFSFGSPAPNPSAPAFKFGSADATSNQNTGFPFGSTQGGFSFGQAPQSAPSSNPPSTPNTPVGFAIPGDNLYHFLISLTVYCDA